MVRAQCYYDILGVAETATADEIKKAYKAQALVWHPDKNAANPDEAHSKFQAILKAYETLNDPRERNWYDRHKDLILSGGDKEEAENCINLFQYFSSSCYANFDDSEDGFYTVYRNLFDEIAEEEKQALDQSTKFCRGKNKNKSEPNTNTFPTFGNSNSEYDEVVRPFYAFWSGFCTNLTFDHLDKYNTTEAENRRILRLMEKENKKVKDAAKKERNTNVRNLMEFVKKRDKRLKAHKLLVDQQNEVNRKKTLEKQRQQREKSQKEVTGYKPSVWLEMDDVEEQLRQLEDEYDDFDFKKNRKGRNNRRNDVELEVTEDHDGSLHHQGTIDGDLTNQDDSVDKDEVNLAHSDVINDEAVYVHEEKFYCPACSKDFSSANAFENHESSKKHKQKVQKLTKLLKIDDNYCN